MPGGVVFLIVIPTSNYENQQFENSETASYGATSDLYGHDGSNLNINLPDNKGVLRLEVELHDKNARKQRRGGRTNQGDVIGRKRMNRPQSEPKAKLDALIPIEKVLEEILAKLEIDHVSWTTDRKGHYHHVIFPLESGEPCETTLHCLTELGIGTTLNTCVSVLPCSVSYDALNNGEIYNESESDPDKISKWNNFIESIKSKLTVKQVVDGVRAGGSTSFDYILLIVTADSLAALGLIENNAPNIVAAMLVSPLMGPVMSITFGTIISDYSLIKVGFGTLILGMFISLLFGFIFGLIVGTTEMPWGFTDWPTEEMKGRGNVRSLWMGVCWALTSGTGVAVALLQGSTGPLIGVAISASLLPPVVNCGLFWGLACIWLIYPGIKMPHLANEPYTGNSSYKFLYTNYVPTEFFINGIVSGILTVVNVICIFITAIIVLKIKEVAAPYTASPDLRRFWETDIRTVRKTNRSTIRGKKMTPLTYAALNDEKTKQMEAALQQALKEATDDATFRKVKRMSYSSNAAGEMGRYLHHKGPEDDLGAFGGAEDLQKSILKADRQVIDKLVNALLERRGQEDGGNQSNRLSRRRTFSRSLTNSMSRRGSKDNHGIQLTSFMPTIMEQNQSAKTSWADRRSRASSIKNVLGSIGASAQRLSQNLNRGEENVNLTQNILE